MRQMTGMDMELLMIWELKRSIVKIVTIIRVDVRIVFLNIVMIVLNIKAKYGG